MARAMGGAQAYGACRCLDVLLSCPPLLQAKPTKSSDSVWYGEQGIGGVRGCTSPDSPLISAAGERRQASDRAPVPAFHLFLLLPFCCALQAPTAPSSWAPSPMVWCPRT